jgi:hypothetical protein
MEPRKPCRLSGRVPGLVAGPSGYWPGEIMFRLGAVLSNLRYMPRFYIPAVGSISLLGAWLLVACQVLVPRLVRGAARGRVAAVRGR